MADIGDRDPWFLCPRPRRDASLRLFCLPFAGSGASIYHAWPNAFPPSVEVRAIQLPGRESRFREPRIASALILAKGIADALGPYLDRRFALFGYSMGALLAFEVTRELRRREHRLPSHLFVAATKAPHYPKPHPPLAHLPREEFLDQIRYYYQPSEAAWEIPELLEIFLPVLRDDAAMYDNYEYADEHALPCPIDAYVGAADRATPVAGAEAWREQTSAEFELTVFPGSHFFVQTALPELQGRIRKRLVKMSGDDR